MASDNRKEERPKTNLIVNKRGATTPNFGTDFETGEVRKQPHTNSEEEEDFEVFNPWHFEAERHGFQQLHCSSIAPSITTNTYGAGTQDHTTDDRSDDYESGDPDFWVNKQIEDFHHRTIKNAHIVYQIKAEFDKKYPPDPPAKEKHWTEFVHSSSSNLAELLTQDEVKSSPLGSGYRFSLFSDWCKEDPNSPSSTVEPSLRDSTAHLTSSNSSRIAAQSSFPLPEKFTKQLPFRSFSHSFRNNISGHSTAHLFGKQDPHTFDSQAEPLESGGAVGAQENSPDSDGYYLGDLNESHYAQLFGGELEQNCFEPEDEERLILNEAFEALTDPLHNHALFKGEYHGPDHEELMSLDELDACWDEFEGNGGKSLNTGSEEEAINNDTRAEEIGIEMNGRTGGRLAKRARYLLDRDSLSNPSSNQVPASRNLVAFDHSLAVEPATYPQPRMGLTRAERPPTPSDTNFLAVCRDQSATNAMDSDDEVSLIRTSPRSANAAPSRSPGMRLKSPVKRTTGEVFAVVKDRNTLKSAMDSSSRKHTPTPGSPRGGFKTSPAKRQLKMVPSALGGDESTDFESFPVKIGLSPSSKNSRESVTLKFESSRAYANNVQILKQALLSTPKASSKVAADFNGRSRTIIVTGPAGSNLKKFVEKYFPAENISDS